MTRAVGNRRALPVRHHGVLTGAGADDVLVTTSIGPNGEVVALWTSRAGAAALTATTSRPGWATFPDPRTAQPVAVLVTAQGAGSATAVRISDLPLAHPTVHLLPDGRVLVVAARCRWRPDGPDRNAIIYDRDGRVTAEKTIGDGVEHVRVARTGHVWVGYFDEGVYGNYGWGGGDGPTPLGAPGLVRFSPDLEPDWRYPSHVDQPWGPIDDCYALNVAGDTAWACYYSDFPVVRIAAGTVTSWRNTIAQGVRALAVADGTVALCGGYGSDRDVLVLARLDHDRLHKLAEYRLVLPDGSPLPATTRITGRGADLHLIDDGDWYRLDLDDLRPGYR